MLDAVLSWLNDGGDKDAASLVEQCEINLRFDDIYFEVGGNGDFEVFDAIIAAPRKVHTELAANGEVRAKIESAIRCCGEADETHVKDIHWVAKTSTPSQQKDRDVLTTLTDYDSEHVARFWRKCLERKATDPDGAITAARSMLESVCKHILCSLGKPYDNADTLPSLFHNALESLSLAPRQQTDRTLRQMLGNCQSVVNSIGAIRNDIGDAHGQSASYAIADQLHAELAVNISSSVALFMLGKLQECQTTVVTL